MYDEYERCLREVLEHGKERKDRTGVGTISIFGYQLRYDLSECGFPAVTTKKLAWRAVVSELLWFLEGSTCVHRLAEIKADNTPYENLTEKQKHTIWTANFEKQGKDLGYENGYLGPIYGEQWRSFNGVDQIQNCIDLIKTDPYSRRIMVNAWNPEKLPRMALPPCHYGFQFYVSGDDLSLMWNQRSVDIACGLPFNIASYALLLHIISRMTNKKPKYLIGNLGDCHIYKNHIGNAKAQVSRSPFRYPTLKMPDIDYSGTIDDVLKQVKTSDFVLENYISDNSIKFEMVA